MSSNPSAQITPEQYLEIERKAEHKSEFLAGEMFAMAGAPETHKLIAGNFFATLHNLFRHRNCRVYASDMRVRVNATGLYTYPDVLAICGDAVFADQQRDTLLNPTVIVEVLSPSTESYDRGRKFENYQTVPSLVQYVLVASDRVHVDVYTRESEGRWGLSPFESPDSVIELSAIEARLTVADLYEKTKLLPDGEA